MRKGFVPLSSSILSSEPDYDHSNTNNGRKPFQRLSANIISSNTLSATPRTRNLTSSFSFETIKSTTKRPRLDNAAQRGELIADKLESLLLQPVNTTTRKMTKTKQASSTAPLMSYEELDELLSQSHIPPLDFDLDSICSDMPPPPPHPPLNTTNTSYSSDMAMDLFSENFGDQNVDPFFGISDSPFPVVAVAVAEKSRSSNSSNVICTPRPPPRSSKVVAMHDLVKNVMCTPNMLDLKIIQRNTAQNNPLTPRFSKKIAQKAIESKSKSREERRHYVNFLKNLCADNYDDEEEEDELYDFLGESDDGQNSIVDQQPTGIPNKELLELFAEDGVENGENDEDDDDDVHLILPDLDKPAIFDQNFLSTLERQLNVHFQLLVQSLALSGEIKDADQVWVTTLKLMIRISDQIEQLNSASGSISVNFVGSQGLALLLRILKQSPLHETLLSKIRKISNDPDLRLRASVQSLPFHTKFSEGKISTFSKSFWHILSIFGEPFSMEYSFLPAAGKPFKSDLAGRRSDSFLPVEDQLLLLGLKRYGLGNWERIQVQLLPTRTAKQIATRYKNLSARLAPCNPVKEFSLEAMRPLSKVEEELLLQGVRAYGEDWVSISLRFLPHRPPTVLKRIWLRRLLMKGTICNLEFPSEDEEDSDYVESSSIVEPFSSS